MLAAFLVQIEQESPGRGDGHVVTRRVANSHAAHAHDASTQLRADAGIRKRAGNFTFCEYTLCTCTFSFVVYVYMYVLGWFWLVSLESFFVESHPWRRADAEPETLVDGAKPRRQSTDVAHHQGRQRYVTRPCCPLLSSPAVCVCVENNMYSHAHYTDSISVSIIAWNQRSCEMLFTA